VSGTEAGKRKGLLGRLFGGPEVPPALPDGNSVTELQQEASETGASTAVEPVEDAATAGSAAAIDEARPVVSPATTEADAGTGIGAVTSGPAKTTWYQRLKDGLGRTSTKLSDGITGLFTKSKLDATTLDDLEDLLIQADIGAPMAQRISETISRRRYDKGISADEVRAILAQEVQAVLAPVARPMVVDGTRKPHVIMMVGVNGAGKTTTIGKLAASYAAAGNKVMLAAGDTFRAAAIEQLTVWGQRTGCPVIARPVGSDAAGLAFDALQAAQEQGMDVLLLDTAGRLQNKQGLMDELKKIVRVLKKLDPTAPHDVVLVLDATTGQNALSQVDVFREQAGVTGLVMTKLDGTARGGILVAIAERFGLPVHAIGVGEQADDLQPFEAAEFANAIARA
jgi:fused signal recognition particle receptor